MRKIRGARNATAFGRTGTQKELEAATTVSGAIAGAATCAGTGAAIGFWLLGPAGGCVGFLCGFTTGLAGGAWAGLQMSRWF